jgi:translation initiation factor RLI1
MADRKRIEEILRSSVADLSGGPIESIKIHQPLEVHLDTAGRKALVVMLGNLAPIIYLNQRAFLNRAIGSKARRQRDPETEALLILDNGIRLSHVADYLSYLAGDPDYPRPPKGK